MSTDFTKISDVPMQGDLKLFIDIAFTINLEFGQDKHQSLIQTRTPALALARTLARALTLARDRALATDHAVARGRDISAARIIAHQRDVDHDTDRELDLLNVIKTLGSTSNMAEPKFMDVLRAQGFIEEKMSRISSTVLQVRLATLNDLLNVAMAKDISSARSVHRTFLLHTLESAYINLRKIEGALPQSRWGKQMTDKLQPHFLNLSKIYLWLRVITERESGRLPAWEGIRIVRTRGSS
jgi:hypothetical protein